MKQVPIIHSGHSQLLLFFTGWAADETPFAHYRPNDMDYAVCYDYRTQAWDTTFLNGYQEINIVAWSMGVWMVNQLYGTLSALPIRHCIAINGTPYPMDDRRGIPVDIFRGTLENLTPASLHNFLRRMCADSTTFRQFLKVTPRRPFEEVREELARIYNIVSHESTEDGNAETGVTMRHNLFTQAVVGSTDRIIPPDNQLCAWQELDVPVIRTDDAHYTKELFTQYLETLWTKN